MSKHSNTNFKENTYASDYQRISGRRNYGADLDMIGYTYDNNNQIVPVVCFDWKYPGDSTISDNYSSIQLQKVIADKLKIPSFLALTFLGDEHPIKCYYLVPNNDDAMVYARPNGQWFSLKDFSKLQHTLRGLPWHGEEQINSIELLKVNLPGGLTLNDLSEEICKYPLPPIRTL